ncbi:MAG: FHA domain-containing protein [Myxococcota bacterium]
MSGALRWVIGADPTCDIVLDHPKISGRHAVLQRLDDRYGVLDLGSRNGTWVRGARIGSEWVSVDDQEAIGLGTDLAHSPMELIALRREPRGTVHWLVGAADDCDVRLEHPRISGQHARISRCGTRVWVTDLGSTNGTFVGDEQVMRTELRPGDPLRLGSLRADWQSWLADRAGRQTWIVGAGDEADIRVNNGVVSSKHARLTRDGRGRWWIEDLGSRNGVMLNGDRVERALLPPDAVVGLGPHPVAASWLIGQVDESTVSAPATDRPHDLPPQAPPRPTHKAAQAHTPAVVSADEADEIEEPGPSLPQPRRTAPARPTPTSGGSAWSLVLILALLAGGGWWWMQHGRGGGSRPPAPTPAPTPSPTPAPAPSDDGNAWVSAWSMARPMATPAGARSESEVATASFGAAPKGADGVGLPAEQADLLVETAYLRQQLDPSALKGVPTQQLRGTTAPNAQTYAVSAGNFAADYVIPGLDNLPIRDQESRGTCAAFAAIGAIEHACLKQRPELGTLNLSEQRFYWIAKPQCQQTGCAMGNEGSSYAQGYSASENADSSDIPLERDCPYNPRPGPTDTQAPQPP